MKRVSPVGSRTYISFLIGWVTGWIRERRLRWVPAFERLRLRPGTGAPAAGVGRGTGVRRVVRVVG
ncbi:hypothetical protein GCM10010485_58240 [Streptosporangium carneum]